MNAKIKVITAMLIFGSISIFVRKIDLPSSVISLLRGIIGSFFLYSFSLATKRKISVQAIKDNFILLLLSGAAMGFNWIFLFQAYKYTTVSNATLTYYFAPAIVVLLSPFILKEKLTFKKFICVVIAIIGLFMIVDTGGIADQSNNHIVGITYGLIAALLYASIIILNKFFKNLTGLEATLIQLVMSAIVLTPYVLIVEKPSVATFKPDFIPYILILGIVYTGFSYLLYFSGMQKIKGQTIAVLSYIDPITAVVISSVLLRERMSIVQIIGGLLILGSSFFSEKTQLQDEIVPDSNK